ncbi:uncharacterized protein LOC8064228 [Sorghum bicolor]|uniref:uncharacterized protein LOC8064228 n=1 Tax=Sorghum bicolor TaxID=4558 RepID=UPI000B4269C1|nr:uncharacterized protein LOC8064228 [Sorghum bicolor]|eukprot:XP_021316247.1 uncharacterized protein LOC8064228 [Sorghum bicolor]
MDSDVPAMGFLHGYLLEAKREIAVRFDNDEEKYKPIWEIIDKRWDNKLKSPLHLAGYYLNPYYYYPNKTNIEKDGSFRAAVIDCVTTLIDDEDIQDNIIEDLNKYKEQQGSFGHDIATRRRRNKDFNPATWWLNHGTATPNLRLLAIKILSLTCSSSACERNWSSFESVHTKKRNRLLHDRMRDLVFVKFNSILRQKKENKGRDPLEKEINDVLEDDNNEFITGVEPNASLEDQECTEPSTKAQDAATSQAKAKRIRAPRPRKKFRTLSSLMTPQSASSASESEENQDDMVFTDAEDD